MAVSQPGNPPAPLGAGGTRPVHTAAIPSPPGPGAQEGLSPALPVPGDGNRDGNGEASSPNGAAPAQGSTSLGEPAFPVALGGLSLLTAALTLPRPVLPFLQSSLEADSHWESSQ